MTSAPPKQRASGPTVGGKILVPHVRRRALGPNFNTLEELLASSEVSDKDKHRAYKCWKRREMVAFRVMKGYGEQPEPLSSGDEVVLVGLGHNNSLNGEAGVLGAYDPESERWEIPARVKEQNLVKKQWIKAARYNCSTVASS